jgi:hypothetical protein
LTATAMVTSSMPVLIQRNGIGCQACEIMTVILNFKSRFCHGVAH